jgi:hypothetical protein
VLKPYNCVAPPEHSTPVWKFIILVLVIVEKFPAVREIPTPEGEEDSKVMSAILTVLLAKIRVFAGVEGMIITALGESPTIEMPSVVMVRGPALLFSIYIPALMRMHTGLLSLASVLATVIALATLAYGVVKDPSPVVSLPYLAT